MTALTIRGYQVTYLAADRDGLPDMEEFKNALPCYSCITTREARTGSG
jgi:hypothetical protein